MKSIKKIKILSLFITCVIVVSCVNIGIAAYDLQSEPVECCCCCEMCEKCECCETCMIYTDCLCCENIAANQKQDEQPNQAAPGITLVYPTLGINAGSAILMEAATGTVLYEHNADEAFPPASVTKVMSMLLIMEGIAEGRINIEDKVVASEYAGSMGGSQIYLEPGEEMTVDDLLKAIVVSSANDATVALAEHLMGSVEAFVARMNERAQELGMTNTLFLNTTGLDDDGHASSARDIAVMSRELLTHAKIFDYTKIWMDTLRNGEFGISNTNRLIRFYTGANGLKTGSTGLAKYCLSASAERNGMQLIAVIMAAPSSDERFAGAKKMLDFGFATYSVYKTPQEEFAPVRVTGGVSASVGATHGTESFLINKGKEKNIEKQIKINESVAAPVKIGEKIGTINYMLDGNLIKSADITAAESVERISFWGIFGRMAKKYFLIG